MEAAIVGRTAELTAVRELVDDDRPQMRALVIDGEAGMGKTTLWSECIAHARQSGLATLIAQPAATEAGLPFAALGDLLGPLSNDGLSALSMPLRAALEVALQRRDADGPLEQLAVARATHELLAAQDGSIVIAIDDVQWLDVESERVLEFALRRLVSLPLRVLVARRSEQELPAPLGLDRALSYEQLEVRRLGPMTVGEVDKLLRARLDRRLSRPQLVRLREASGGNPFYALEIARTADGDGFHVPASLTHLLRARLDALPQAALDAALLAAAAGRPTALLVERAAASSDGLAQAVDAELLEVDGTRLRFTHPLLASVVYESAPPWKRRQAHRRLAEVAEGEERARNLALATNEPDEAVASELEQTAESVAALGAPSSAASLLEHAARVTPGSEPTARRARLLAAAEQHFHAGDHDRSRELLEQLVAEVSAGPERARILARLSQVATDESEGLALCRQALEESGGDPALDAELHHRIAASMRRLVTLAEAEDHARRAVSLAERVDDPLHLARALAMLGASSTSVGRRTG